MTNLDSLATEIEQSTIYAIKNLLPPQRNTQNKKQITPFWCAELNRLKRITRAKRKIYQKARNPELRNRKLEYQKAKQEFREKIKQKKIETWTSYLDKNLTLDPWGNPYKLRMAKTSATTISTLKKPDGTKTGNLRESAQVLMEALIPLDNKSEYAC